MDWKRGEVASRLSAALFLCCSSTLHCSSIAVGIKFLLGAGGLGGWVLLGWTGLVLSGTTRNPARLVYGSAALVASLRGQQSHFATLPTKDAAEFLAAAERSGLEPAGRPGHWGQGAGSRGYGFATARWLRFLDVLQPGPEAWVAGRAKTLAPPGQAWERP